MKAGELKQRITIQIPQRSKNAFGEWIDTFADWVTVWAALEPLTGGRYLQSKQLTAEVTGVVRIRYRTGLLPTMRLLYGMRIFNIVSIVQPKEAKRELHIYYREALD